MPMDRRDDSEIADLVSRAQSGNTASLSQLFERLVDRIYRFFAIRTSDREVAEDLTQTVFLEMIRSLPRYKVRGSTKFTTWLFQIARFRLIDHYRRQRPSVPIEAAPEPSHEPLAEVDPFAADRLKAALQTLPERYQTVLHLRFREGCSSAEIAAIMQTSTLNVRVIQFRALRALRSKLTPHP